MRDLPEDARETAGFQLYKVQQGKYPDDWKPMASIGRGTHEIRIRGEGGAYRILYVAKFEEAVYVLHVFQKRSPKTSRPDLALARARYTDLLKWRKEQGL